MVGITFQNAELLLGLFAIPIIIALHFLLLNLTKKRAVRFANFDALKRVTGHMVLSKNVTLLLFRILIIICLVFSAAGTTFWYAGQRSDTSYAIAIDASSSMFANDFTPNRLEAAKEVALEFLHDVVPDQTYLSVVSFAGTSFLLQQITDDKNTVRDAILSIEIGEVGGTDLGEAIVTGVNSLMIGNDSKAIILLTDGRSTVGTPVDEGIAFARRQGVAVYPVGMATRQGGEFENTDLISSIDEDSLNEIANQTGGQFYLAEDRQSLLAAFQSIESSVDQNIPFRLQGILLIIGVVLIFVEWILLNTKFRVLP